MAGKGCLGSATRMRTRNGVSLTGEKAMIPVVYIGGCQRSGSTLLDRMLSQVPEHLSAGEVVHLWIRGLGGNELCGCGAVFLDCPFWTEVGRIGFGGWDQIAGSRRFRPCNGGSIAIATSSSCLCRGCRVGMSAIFARTPPSWNGSIEVSIRWGVGRRSLIPRSTARPRSCCGGWGTSAARGASCSRQPWRCVLSPEGGAPT